MGLLDGINTASGDANSNNFLPAGQHEVEVTKIEVKEGTVKNVGKTWIIISLKVLKSSRTDVPGCSQGMPASVFIEMNMFPDMGKQKFKNFMLGTATEEDLAGYPRANLAEHLKQENDPTNPNPYVGQANGITWGEYAGMLIDPNIQGAKGSKLQVTAIDVDRSAKNKPPVTNYDFRSKAITPYEIVASPIQAAAPAQPAAVAVAAQPAAVAAPATGQPAAVAALATGQPATLPAPATPAPGGSIFG